MSGMRLNATHHQIKPEVKALGFFIFNLIAIPSCGDYMTEHEKWLKEQVEEAMDKAGRGESVYLSNDEVKTRMDAFKKKIAEKHST